MGGVDVCMTKEQIDVPDSPEVRIARLDESLKNLLNRFEAISEAYAPTNRTVIENALRISELDKDISDLRGEMGRQIDRREKIVEQIEKQLLACATGVGELERRWEKQQREAEHKEQEDRVARNRWIIGLAVAIFCVVLSVYLGTILG